MQNTAIPLVPTVRSISKFLGGGCEPSLRTSVSTYVEQGCYAVKVRTCGEEGVARTLRQKGLKVLSPVYTESRRYSDRLKKTKAALFPGYIFVNLNGDTMLRVLSTNGVNYVVRFGSKVEPLTEPEVKAIEAFCRAGECCRPCSLLRVGQRVMIEQGLFAGLIGVLQKVQDENNVVIAIESLHQAVSVATGASALRVL